MTTLLRSRRMMPVGMVAAAVVAVMVVAAGFGAAGAHGETHPAHIHKGTCANLGDVVFPLSNVGTGVTDAAGTAVAAEIVGDPSAIAVDVSVTTVAASLQSLVDGGYAINVHESDEAIGNYIACGAVGGTLMGDDLAIGLAELNDSGYSGVAWLHGEGDATTVTLFLTEESDHDEEGDAEGTPETAGDDGGGAAAVAVEIRDFAYSPNPIEVAVGTTITWTNQDSAAHTATQTGGGFNTNTLDQGDSASVTIDETGTFEYHCEFHANMNGTIIAT